MPILNNPKKYQIAIQTIIDIKDIINDSKPTDLPSIFIDGILTYLPSSLSNSLISSADNVLFFVLKPHILARINVYKEELIERTWVPERIEYVIPSLDLKQWKY